MKVKDVSIVSKLGWYATFIMPEHIWNDPQYKDFTSNPANWQPVGSGPYKFDNYKSGVATTLVKNSDYFDGEPIIEKLIFTIVPDSTTAFQSFVNGEIDYFNIIVPTANKHDLDNNPDYRFFDYISINRTYLTFNMKEGRFTDPRLRQAVAKGVDRQGIFDRVSNGAGALFCVHLVTQKIEFRTACDGFSLLRSKFQEFFAIRFVNGLKFLETLVTGDYEQIVPAVQH